MKRKTVVTSFFLAGALVAGGLSFALASTIKTSEPEKAEASSSSYWDSWISSHSSELSTGGTALVSALKQKITQVADGSNNTVSYNGLWSAYKDTDSVPGSNGAYIWDMYGGFQFPYQSQGASYSVEGDCYNREHSVPKSWFSEKTPAYSDIIHLVPTDGKVNGMRSNYTFGEVSSASYTYSFPARSYQGVQYQAAGSSKLGSPKTINGVSCSKNIVFEPDDQYKGDFARIYMYFAVRYGGGTCQATTGDGGSIFTSTFTDSNPYMTNYGLALMQKWHVQDPVSEKETVRNDGVQTHQGNRNPFVDYPEWADLIFGTNYGGGTPDPGTPTVTSVTVSPSTLALDLNGTKTGTLTATVNGKNNPSQSVTWSISPLNQGVTVSNGTVTASNNATTGTYTVTATSVADNTKSGTCTVTLTDSSQGGGESGEVSGSVSAQNSALERWTLSGTGTYTDGSVKFDSSNDKVYKLDIFSGVVSANMTSLTVTINGKLNGTDSANNSYKVEAVGPTGNALAYDSYTGTIGTSYGDKTFTINSGLAGCTGIRVTYVTKASGNWGIKTISWTATYSSSIPSATLSSISTSGQTTSYYVGEVFSYDGTCTATYSDASTKTVIPTVTGGDTSTAGNKTVTLSYTEDDVTKTCSYQITVSAVAVTSVSLNSSSESINVGGTVTLTATVLPNNATNKNVSWLSSNTSVATVSGGTITGVAKGTATITVTTQDGSKTDTCTITVLQQVTGVSLDKSSLSLTTGNTGTLTATVSPSDASNKNVTWSTSNSNVATVSNGTVTAVAAGTATITVETVDGGFTDECSVTVTDPIIHVTGVSLNYTSKSVEVNSSFQLEQTIAPSNATEKSVSWSSSNDGVATVSGGLVRGIVVGTATITVTTVDGGFTATCTVTVTEASGGISSDPLVSSGIQDGMSVVWGTTNTNLATGISSNWVSLSAISSSWIIFTLEGSSSGFTLRNGNNYVYCSSEKKISFSTTNSTTFTLDDNNRVYNSTAGTCVYNPNNGNGGLRPYKTISSDYTDAFLFSVNSGGDTPTPTPTNASFKIIESQAEIMNGTQLVIAYINGDTVKVMKNYNTGNFHYTVAGTYSSETGMLTPADDYSRWTVGDTDLGYTFKNANNQYLYSSSDTKSYLVAGSALTTTSYWEITVESDSSHSIKNLTNSNMTTVCYATSYTNFDCESYSTASNILMFADVAATTQAFVDNYMHMSDYTSNLGWCKDQEHGYYEAAKERLLAMGSAYIYEFQENDAFNAAQARYETWASFNGDTTPYYDSGSNSASLTHVSTNNVVTTITVLTLCTLSISAIYLALKHRKFER